METPPYIHGARQRHLLAPSFHRLDARARQALLRQLVHNALTHNLTAVDLAQVAHASGLTLQQAETCFATTEAPLKLAIAACVNLIATPLFVGNE